MRLGAGLFHRSLKGGLAVAFALRASRALVEEVRELSERGHAATGLGRVALHVDHGLVVLGRAVRETYLLRLGLDAEYAEVQLLTDLRRVFGALDALVRKLRDVAQAFQPFGQLDERAEVREASHLAAHDVARLVLVDELLPRARLGVLDGEREASVVDVDVRDDGLYLLPLLQGLARMLDALVPGDVGDVNEPVHPVLDLDEGAEVRQVADAPADAVADVEALGQRLPGVRLRLLHAEAYAPVLRVDA